MRGLLKLTWLEIKIFVREPMGVFGTVGIPVLVFLIASRLLGPRVARAAVQPGGAVSAVLPVLASILMSLSAITSLVTIVSIYREGGILKRLRATPLRPWTILTAHVIVKLLFTALTVLLMIAAGKRYYPADLRMPVVSFTLALLVCTFSILSIGFVIASLVPTARFAQPITAAIFYPMIALCGMFVPIEMLPPGLQAVSRVLPLTYAVSLLRGILLGDPWRAHLTDLAALGLVFAVCTAISARVFRWE